MLFSLSVTTTFYPSLIKMAWSCKIVGSKIEVQHVTIVIRWQEVELHPARMPSPWNQQKATLTARSGHTPTPCPEATLRANRIMLECWRDFSINHKQFLLESITASEQFLGNFSEKLELLSCHYTITKTSRLYRMRLLWGWILAAISWPSYKQLEPINTGKEGIGSQNFNYQVP